MAEDFVNAVDDGLKLSKRIYFGKDRSVAPPKPMAAMEKSSHSYLPSSPMVYAVISDPAMVDNPDIPSYQPHVHGRCDPPALIPLQMNGIGLEVDCCLDTAFVTVTGSWRVHCVMGSRHCDCRVAIPMGEQGSLLGVEVDTPRKSYCIQQIAMDDKKDTEKAAKFEIGGFLKSHIFTFTIPQVDGGSNISIKVSWSQKLLYSIDQLSLSIPFSFPEYVTPAGKKISKKEKIQLNVNAGPGTEVLCKTTSHPLKEQRRQVGKLSFLYESEVLHWSSNDFIFSWTVSSSHIFGGVLLQSPSVLDSDQREMFCLYLFPGNQQNQKVFRKEVVFVVDISGSMRGKPLEDMKNALSAALSKLDPNDSFNIIAFNGETYQFSSNMELVTQEAIEKAMEWINVNFVVGDGTNILLPLNQAIEMLGDTRDSIPVIFLITDGSVEDERHICDVMKSHLTNRGSICPRIYTFGIGTFCNHYFLRMLAIIGRGHHDAAYDAADWWIRFGSKTPELTKFAIRILSLTCSASGCERNWSTFESIHTKKRNRLEHKRLNALVYVKYNTKLRERSIRRRQNIDPILIDEIDSDDEWIAEKEDPVLSLDASWLDEEELFDAEAIRTVPITTYDRSVENRSTTTTINVDSSSNAKKRKVGEGSNPIEARMKAFFGRALSTTLANIAFDTMENVDELEVYPSRIPDLLSESPLIVSGRYKGDFPETLKARGILADTSNFVVDLKVQKAKDIPIDKVLAKQEIELLTAQAWFSENKELEEEIARMSVKYDIVSEYTCVILLETERGKNDTESTGALEAAPSRVELQKMVDSKGQKIKMLRSLGIGFGNLTATTENTSPGSEEDKLPEAAEMFVKAASNCCGRIFGHCCCMCCIQTCSRMNDQCAIALTQLCGALVCLGCFSCCEVCCSGREG